MKRLPAIPVICFLFSGIICQAQTPQGFFLDDWQPRTTTSPEYNDTPQTTAIVNVAVTIDFTDTLTKISKYLFGDNANLWTGPMSNNPGLMRNIANRDLGVLRGPGGSISDVYFWDAMLDTPLDSVPATLAGSTSTDWMWYGKRPFGWDNWTMDVDSFYKVLGHVGATGMITVNYGYARYGTSMNPVTKAAHMAANRVRYDNGRSKFWEIGNEVFGSWEAGYRIDQSLNRDGQPAVITPALYGQHCRIFIDSMKAAAAERGADIKVGVVMAEASSTSSGWSSAVAAQVGDKADFYVIHSYFTPYNENSTVETILNTPGYLGSYISYVWGEADKVGKPHLPVALTEYNIWALGSGQQISHINGIHAVLVAGEAMKTGLGAACRWDLANGYDNGNDHGLFSYNEPGLPNYTPHAPFFHLYYLRRFTGDILLNSSMVGSPGLVVIPSAFHSGHVAAAVVNTSRLEKVVRVNIAGFGFGNRYYTYTLAGIPGEDFSRKVYVNGSTTNLAGGGPADYETIKANSSLIGDEIVFKVPALSVVYLLVEPGTKVLAINNDVGGSGSKPADEVFIYPNPAPNAFTIGKIPSRVYSMKVKDLFGRTLFEKSDGISSPEESFTTGLKPGIYYVNLYGDNLKITRKLVIK